MDNNSKKKVFISYSHKDKQVAESIAQKLNELGTNVFFAEWDILPGDSLVDKIFEEGLKNACAFIIILSNNSINSNWVREELNYATVSRIEKKLKIIPILIENVDIPAPLNSLLWVNLQSNFEEGIVKINKSIHGLYDKNIGKLPAIISSAPIYDGNLTKISAIAAIKILESIDIDSSQKVSFKNFELAKMLDGIKPDEINDIVGELEEVGIVKVIRYLGTAPYSFGEIIPTYMIFIEFKDRLSYDPMEDLKIVASSLVSNGSANGKELESSTKLSIGRLNRAVDYLLDYGVINARRYMGTSPYSFGHAEATRKTKQYVESN